MYAFTAVGIRVTSTSVHKFLSTMTSKIYVVVHGGAGVHSKASEAEVKQVLRLACTQTLASASASAAAQVESGTTPPSALDLVENSIVSLEDSSILNAGYGSNLTLSGTVECDAALMDGRTGDFGSAGAVSGIKNPVRLARLILEHARVPDPLGRIPPLTLVSHGAHAFVEQYITGKEDINALTVPPESLVTPRARKTWEVWKARLEDALSSASSSVGSAPRVPSAENLTMPGEEDEDDHMNGMHAMQDTVGAVAFVSSANTSINPYSIAAGVSSGGILLKHPGRIGEAAVYGAGCWARASVDNPGQKRKLGVACSVSGAGEYIVRANLARAIADALDDASTSISTTENGQESEDEEDIDVHAILQRVLAEEFWIPAHSPTNPDPSAGVVLLTTEEDAEEEIVVRLWCAFTTPSMAIAYASSDNPRGKVRIVLIQGTVYVLRTENTQALILRRPKSVESRPNDRPRIFVTGIAL
ncbi:hypothetical protein MSAN_00050800 [Mycena sanguinolenta]|uniref:N-terminal nucleophile aminohydrolase n=1 Tax=Mycena sanguinolenta TaxID=230812 RepID=A0A8H6ZC62_9AGAR|nr:hypothetical protein MSAN_00050800 [Mycena sanguinolenta]